MSQYTQKYTIVCFLEPEVAPVTFSALNWPLHVTMLDVFRTDWSVDGLLNAIRQVASHTLPFSIKPAQQAMLGPGKDVPVRLLLQDASLLSLHRKLLALSHEGSFVFNTPEFVGAGFLPHVTDQQDNQLEASEIYAITTISLIDMFPDGDHMKRAIIGTFALGCDEKYPMR